MTLWTRIVRKPQDVFLRKALFQIHLWSGIGVGLYILIICVTGSVIVYRVELVRHFQPRPIVVKGDRLSDDQLKALAARAHPDYTIASISRGRANTRPVTIVLERNGTKLERVFDPYTGEELGDLYPAGQRALDWTVDLHDNLLAGTTGRAINGTGAALLLMLAFTGAIIWWPGIQRWKRSLSLRWTGNWTAFNWDLHSMMGFWTILFVIMFGVTGLYLGFPNTFSDLVDYLEPPTDANAGRRVGDTITFWLARVHFGRFAGQPVKFLWFLFGLAPAVLFVTGALMWWNRVLRPKLRSVNALSRRSADASAYTPQAPAGS